MTSTRNRDGRATRSSVRRRQPNLKITVVQPLGAALESRLNQSQTGINQNSYRGLVSVVRIVLGILAFTPCLSLATQSVTLGWDPSVDPAVVGYRVYVGDSSGVYSQTLDVGKSTTALVSNLTDGLTYFFSVTAFNSSFVESAPSNEVTYTASGTPLTETSTPTPAPIPLVSRMATRRPSETPSAAPSATPMPNGSPVIRLSVSKSSGNSATCTVRTSVINRDMAITVGYGISGKAIAGIHYNISGIPGQITIPAGSSSASFTLMAIPNGPSNGHKMTARVTLQKGIGYRLSAAKKADVTIVEPVSANEKRTPNIEASRRDLLRSLAY
jgi:hypothetical protein